jgi:hypothetical protein
MKNKTLQASFRRSSSRYSFLSGLSVTSRMGIPTPSLMTDVLLTLRIRRYYDFLRADPRYKDLERRVGYTW